MHLRPDGCVQQRAPHSFGTQIQPPTVAAADRQVNVFVVDGQFLGLGSVVCREHLQTDWCHHPDQQPRNWPRSHGISATDAISETPGVVKVFECIHT